MQSEESQSTHWTQKSVREALLGLVRFDRICVTWVDASESTNVPLSDSPVPNHVVETMIKSEGQFYGVQVGSSFSDPHILILKETTERQRGTVESIPLILVRDIQVYEKIPRKTKHLSDHRYVFRYRDGIVKKLRGFQDSRATLR